MPHVFDPTTQYTAPPKVVCTLRVNGQERQIAVDQSAILLDVLREELNLTGTKRGCDMGTCGCCTVIADGKAILSCLTLALDAEGKDLRTIESLQDSGYLHPIQEGFMVCGGSQCGFCTPGFIMTCTAFLEQQPDLTTLEDDTIRRAISGNLCRCTGFQGILEAVHYAADKLTAGEWPPSDEQRATTPDPGGKVGGTGFMGG
ncbi:MAG: (2Fe-2S)-binding protein [bacterium]